MMKHVHRQRLGLIATGVIAGCSFAYWAEYSLKPVPPTPTDVEGVVVSGELGNTPSRADPAAGFEGLCLKVQNTRQGAIRILWYKTQFIDPDGKGTPALPGDMRPDSVMAETLVPPNTAYEKFVLPNANRRWKSEGQSGATRCSTAMLYAAKSLLSAFDNSATKGAVDRKAGRLIGRIFGFRVPIAIATTEITYNIFFTIDGYRVVHYVDF